MYFLVIIQNNTTQAIYAHESLDSALAAFHQELSYRGEGRTSTVCAILNQIGELVKREDWHIDEIQ